MALRIVSRLSAISIVSTAAVVGLLLLASCGAPGAPTPPVAPPSSPANSLDQIITLGDIDPDEPVKKVKRFQPLADYLAEHLESFGIHGGRVVIARNIDEMGRFLSDGTVDIYFDSPFPSLAVQEISGSKIILRRWKQGEPEYWSTFIALRGNGISSVKDLLGKTIAFEEPHSTSGFLLPAGTLVDRGYNIAPIETADQFVGPEEIGYLFSWDEDNTLEYILQGRVAAGGISNQDYEKLPEDVKEGFVVFDRTISVPRQLVSVRPDLDAVLAVKVRALLLSLDQTEEGRLLLKGLKNTRKFDPLPPASESALGELKTLMKLVSE